jgi:hypothetical protein
MEVQSPLKQAPGMDDGELRDDRGQTARKLQLNVDDNKKQVARKRKSKQGGLALQTPDLNEPVGSNAIVPVGLVNSRVYQLDTGSESSTGVLEETLKKQRRGSLSNNARSAAAASGSPRRAQ